MECGNDDVSTYSLISQLCERILETHDHIPRHPYIPVNDNAPILKKLRSTAYGILLNKSRETYHAYNDTPNVVIKGKILFFPVTQRQKENDDPVIELLKHAFVVKVSKKSATQGIELTSLLNELIESGTDADPLIYSTLQLLVSLKNFEPQQQEKNLNIFHYERLNPLLPEPFWDGKDVIPFQTYPMESFILPDKFEAMLGIKQTSDIQDYAVEPGSRLSFLGRFRSSTTVGIETIENGNTTLSIVSDTSKGVMELAAPRDYIMPSYFLPSIIEVTDIEDESLSFRQKSVTEIEPPWEREVLYPIHQETRSSTYNVWNFRASNQDFYEELDSLENNSASIWEDAINAAPVSNYRTWNMLGQLDPAKEPNFIGETRDAIFHLQRIKQADVIRSLSRNMLSSMNMIMEIPSKQFLSDVRLLLLGIESETFTYDNQIGFCLRPNSTIPGLSVQALNNIGASVTEWGNCYRALTLLTSSHPQTGKLQQDGLIFKAMCNSIREVLLGHQAVVLRIPIDQESLNILKLIETLRPLGLVITELARLCHCDGFNQVNLNEGLGILTHIYQEVTKVTQPNIALIFYSILKACCEVYFRFMQKWLFEGVCDDIYGEFMIKVRPQYLRQQGYRFWTKGFVVNQTSVPGFLEELTESILQCGKTVRLLKICDPKNPLCIASATSYPAVRVCLSVSQLREQQRHCNEYLTRVQSASGSIVSMSTALQEQRDIFKEKAQRVNEAHQEILIKLKREQEETARQVAQTKRDLLAELKDQAEEAVLRKEKNKEAELQADQLLLERINKEQSEEAARLQYQKDNIMKYYRELAVEAEDRKIHADWRIKRMQLFDERVAAIAKAADELRHNEPEKDIKESFNIAELIEKNKETTLDCPVEDAVQSSIDDPLLLTNCNITIVDDNANEQPTISNVLPLESLVDIVDPPNINMENTNVKPDNEKKQACSGPTTTRSPRPTVLNITPINFHVEPAKMKLNVFTEETLQQSTNRTRQHKSSSDETYHNTVGNIKNDFRNYSVDRTEIKKEALKNRLRNTESCVINPNLTADTDVNSGNKISNNTLGLKKIETTDNMSELQRNRMKVLREEYDLTPNNNEINMILLNDQTQFRKTQNSSADIETQRNVNTPFAVNQGHKLLVDPIHAQSNENENITRQSNSQEHHPVSIEINPSKDLTVWEKNKNMPRSMDESIPTTREKTNNPEVKLTQTQQNENKIMDREFDKCGQSTDSAQSNDNSQVMSPTRISVPHSAQQILQNTTPMSCTTDNFPLSTSSSTSQLQYCIDTPLWDIGSGIPSALPTSELLTAGTARSDVTESGFKFLDSAPMFPKFLGFGSAAMTPTFEASLTVEDVELIDNTSLHVYLEKSVMIPLQVQSRLVNDAMSKYFLEEHKLLSHLHSLRSYFFLLNGEFAKILTKSLFTRLYEIKDPVELMNSTTLNNLLDKALIASLSGTYANAERLSLFAVDVPSQLQISNPDALECLSLNYKISWPLNIIFNDIVMFQYSKVFKFLLMVARVMWVLQEDFHTLKADRKADNCQQYHQIQLYRHAMMQFITALHNYLTCSVLHASWAEFETDLENALTVDQLHLAHIGYIRKILFRCMLNSRGEKMRTCLHNIFKLILKFHNSIRSENWIKTVTGYTHPNYTKLQRLYDGFCELRNYMAHIADKMANGGYQPHLTHFLNSLNMNPLYDLTVRKKN